MDNYKRKIRSMSSGLFVAACLAFAAPLRAQTPVPSPSPSSETLEGRYNITSSVELGVRGIEVNGDHEKYRSDLNYRAGFRVFDSSFLVDDRTNGAKLFDTALITTSGWGADPSGSFRFNMDKAGIYKFDSNVRRVKYFNSLRNHAVDRNTLRGQHNFDTAHTFGDFDLTIFPESDLRFRAGYSFNRTEGPGTNTIRFPSFTGTTTIRGDEFQINSSIKTRSQDLRLGVEGKLLGFNLGLNYGHRIFRDRTTLFLDTFSLGNDPRSNTVNATLNSMTRRYPTRGTTDYVHFFSQRTFAGRLDFTGRFIYAESNTTFEQTDLLIGTSNNPFFVDLDQISVTGDAKRPQARGDIGLTWRVTDDFRISNTFTFDQYNIGGGNRFLEFLDTRTLPAGVVRPREFADASSWRATSYRRLSDLIEMDYQVRNWLAFNIGYRYTNRKVDLGALDVNLRSGATTFTEDEEFENTTHTVIAGTKIKPTKNWAIFADVERGESDNVFTRLANNDFLNFRIRSRASVKQFTANVSFITKDNDGPGTTLPVSTGSGSSTIVVPAFEATAFQRSRYFSASVDWTPRPEFSISGGYTYQYVNSNVDIIVPVGAPLFPSTRFLQGISQYFVRDSYFFFDVSARPIRRVSLYISYRISDDKGQGDRVATRPQDIITSYPMRFQTPEVRVAVKLTKNIDWNVGYQYYDYKERPMFFPFIAQNYNAHLPYTSLRFYFGRSAIDR